MLKADIARYDMQMLGWRMGIGKEVIIDMNVAISLDVDTSVFALSSDWHFFPIYNASTSSLSPYHQRAERYDGFFSSFFHTPVSR